MQTSVMVDLRRWLTNHQAQLSHAGVTGTFSESDRQRSKPSQMIRLETEDAMADTLVWEGGECEVLYGRDPNKVTVEQRRVGSREDLDAVMAEVLAHLRG